jgi:RND family efflux transporter MFP subunit
MRPSRAAAWALPVFVTASVFSPCVDAQEKERAVPVTTARASAEPFQVRITVEGELESPAEPTVAAEIDGQVLETLVQEGETVDAGQPLATLDPEAYEIALERAQAGVARTEALIVNFRRTEDRLEGLKKRQLSAQSELDKAETDLAATIAELAAAKAQVREIAYQLKKTRVSSPIRGVIQTRHVAAGDYVKKGDPLFKIVATERLSARLYFPESLAGQVRVGLPVTLGIGTGSASVEAAITRLLPAADPGNRALSALVDFDNPGNWQPGLSATGNVLLESRPRAVMVPAQSVVRRPGGTVVYRIEQNRALAQPVTLGQRNGDRVEIVSGIAPDMTIAVDGAGFLTDGAAVEIR